MTTDTIKRDNMIIFKGKLKMATNMIKGDITKIFKDKFSNISRSREI